MKRVTSAERTSSRNSILHSFLTGILVLAIWLSAAPQTFAAAPLTAKEADEVFASLSSGKRVEAEEMSYRKPEEPTVYLTFDDGPSAFTPQVLDVLKEEEVRATFFVLGEQAEARPHVVKRIVEEGHAIGNHSYNHVYKELYSNFGAYWEQLQRTEQILFDATGVRTPLVRAPGGTAGNFDAFYFYLLNRGGYSVFDWTIDSEDARKAGATAEDIAHTVAQGPFRHEVTVLMHDGPGHEQTLKALPKIIKLFKDQGYRFAPLSTEVKPAQFGVSKAKWQRGTSWSAFQQQLQAVEEHRPVWAAAGSVAEEAGAGSEVKPAPETALASGGIAAGGPDQLRLRTDYTTVDFRRDGFLFREERFIVPLRELVQPLGAEVVWEPGARTAVVRYGSSRTEYDLANCELRVYREQPQWDPSGHEAVTVIPLPEMELREGSLYVPLRSALELLGAQIVAYEPETDGHPATVRATFRQGLPLELGRLWAAAAKRSVPV
ncbi:MULTISPECIES: polysaccharide deacetylase [Paenibacillus]|nr:MULTISPECIES: polysaccharide deacetylase [Paenibacillus]